MGCRSQRDYQIISNHSKYIVTFDHGASQMYKIGCQWLPLQLPWGVISRYSWVCFPFGISLGNCCPWELQQKFWIPWILRGSSFGHNFPFWWMAFCWALGERPYADRSLFPYGWVKPVMSCWGNRCATAPWNMFAVELFPDLIMSWHAWIIFKAQLSWVENTAPRGCRVGSGRVAYRQEQLMLCAWQ